MYSHVSKFQGFVATYFILRIEKVCIDSLFVSTSSIPYIIYIQETSHFIGTGGIRSNDEET